jgi:hypothetical protein
MKRKAADLVSDREKKARSSCIDTQLSLELSSADACVLIGCHVVRSMDPSEFKDLLLTPDFKPRLYEQSPLFDNWLSYFDACRFFDKAADEFKFAEVCSLHLEKVAAPLWKQVQPFVSADFCAWLSDQPEVLAKILDRHAAQAQRSIASHNRTLREYIEAKDRDLRILANFDGAILPLLGQANSNSSSARLRYDKLALEMEWGGLHRADLRAARSSGEIRASQPSWTARFNFTYEQDNTDEDSDGERRSRTERYNHLFKVDMVTLRAWSAKQDLVSRLRELSCSAACVDLGAGLQPVCSNGRLFGLRQGSTGFVLDKRPCYNDTGLIAQFHAVDTLQSKQVTTLRVDVSDLYRYLSANAHLQADAVARIIGNYLTGH